MVSRRTNFGERSEPAPDRGGKLQSAAGRHKVTFRHWAEAFLKSGFIMNRQVQPGHNKIHVPVFGKESLVTCSSLCLACCKV